MRGPEVRLIDEAGEQLGVVPTQQAIKLAKERGFDLVLVSPGATPPVCRIADIGKLKYEASKKDKETRKSQKGGALKEVKLSCKIALHDFDVRVTRAREFLEKKNKVKASLYFRGRENSHVEVGRAVMDRFLLALQDVGKTEESPKKIGKNMHAIISPK
ncbi:MAG: translation initiation factor IF-3 [bacterium]